MITPIAIIGSIPFPFSMTREPGAYVDGSAFHLYAGKIEALHRKCMMLHGQECLFHRAMDRGIRASNT